MPLIPLQIPPGVYRNGTEYQASNRWHDANLVRWSNGVMAPVGGWTTRVDTTVSYPRAAFVWRDLGYDRWLAVGSATKLKVISPSMEVIDITPAGLISGETSAGQSQGYGGGFYGFYAYGTPRPEGVSFTEATTWALDNWGDRLVACSVADGKLREWDLDPTHNAVAISNAPEGNLSLVVTAERFLFALGAGNNPRRIQWCDAEDNTSWTPLTTNQAGDMELQTHGQIMLGIRTRDQTLIITDNDAHAATYQGPPFVYGFAKVGSACGALSRKSAVSVDEGVFWMGARGFHLYAGGAVQDIPCDVADYLFDDMNMAQASKVYAVGNQQFNEIWWFYPSASSNENDRYVCYNYAENHWSIGELTRTCGVDSGVFRNPIWLGSAGVAYNHETGQAHGGANIFAESGPISLDAGDNVMSATMLIPDEKTQGDVSATFKTRFHPNDVQRTYGPYAMANPTSVRFTGRQIRMRVDGVKKADWRVGIMRLDAVPGGKR